MGRHEEAVQTYEQIKQADSKSTYINVVYWKAVLLERIGRVAEAVTLFDEALQFPHASKSGILYEKSSVLVKLGRVDEALQVLDVVLRLEPDYRFALISKGNILLSLSRETEALAVFKQAQQLYFYDEEVNSAIHDIEDSLQRKNKKGLGNLFGRFLDT